MYITLLCSAVQSSVIHHRLVQCNVVEYSAEQWRLDLGPEDDAAVEPPGEGEEQHGQDRQEAEEDLGGRHHRLTRHRHCHQHNHRRQNNDMGK